METPKTYRLRGTCFLITWSTVTLEHLDVFNHLDNFSPIKRCILARELHQDLQDHFHAYVEFERCLDKRISTHWDLRGKHPNIGSKRTLKERSVALEYCRKGDDWIEFGEWADVDSHDNVAPTELARACMDWGEFLDRAYAEGIPFSYAKAAWDWVSLQPPRVWLEGEIKEGEISSHDLRDLDYTEGDARTALILVGPPGCGKTTWAIRNAPKPLLVCTHIEDLCFFRKDFHKSILFDELSFTHCPRAMQINLVDWEIDRSIHVRFRVVRIPAKTPKIFTCNVGHLPVDISDGAIERRITLFEC